MKKYIIFATSFILLFLIFQVLSGMLHTLIYTPDIATAWNRSAGLSQVVVIKGGNSAYFLNLSLAFLAATIAYFIPGKREKI